MPDNNKTHLILGVVLIVLAFIFVSSSVLFVPGPARLAPDGQSPENENSLAELPKDVLPVETPRKSSSKKQLSPEEYLKRARDIYGPEELERREGTMWTNKSDSSLVVTLGRVNGAFPGKHLAVYDGNILVAEAVVESSSDLTGHVSLVDKTQKDLRKNYYKVVLKD